LICQIIFWSVVLSINCFNLSRRKNYTIGN
jgi:hypothetical protein